MSPGPTFDRVYGALKKQVTSGRFAPGDQLEPAALGEELDSSITPVRDALHRLVGERIVEAPKNDGFRVPSPLEAELRDLYAWNGRLIDLALRRLGAGGHLEAGAGEIEGAADLFRLIAGHAGSAELESAVRNLNDRLAALRAAEADIFPDAAEELTALKDALGAGDAAGLRRLVAAYHRRRQRQVPQILAEAHRRRAD